MTLQRQVIFWLVALTVAVLLLAVFRTILLPFVAGFALAYMLDPLADRLQRVGLGRLGASLIILVLFVLLFIVALMVILPAARASNSPSSSIGCRAMWHGFSNWRWSRAGP